MPTAFKVYDDHPAIDKYKERMMDLMSKAYPLATKIELECAIDDSISKHQQDTPVVIDNNYKKQQVNTSIYDITRYIMEKQPIVTSYGVLFSRHGVVPNPIYTMLDSFIKQRKATKKEMFKYPKGSEDYERLNLLQLLLKIDANGYYGGSGMYTCIYYNLYCAATTTRQGKSCNSASALFFESFLNNNVPISSMNELMEFIYNVSNESSERKFYDHIILDENIDMQEVFVKLVSSCGFGFVPSEQELEILWDVLSNTSQVDLNRLFYKNNLFGFVANQYVRHLILDMLCKLKSPYIDPNEVPEEITNEMKEFYDLLYEYVYYKYQIIDRLDKMTSLIRTVSIIQDTDSAIVSLDGWYRNILESTVGVPMGIKNMEIDAGSIGDDKISISEPLDKVTDYDFLNDDIVERDRLINPVKIIPQDGLRHSIINILSYCITNLVNDFMQRYADNANTQSNGECMLVLKNEFLFKRLLAMDVKKHYASKMELQEGNVIPDTMEKSLDIKGIDVFKKSTVNDSIKERLKEVLYNDILNTPVIDQITVLKDIAIVEREIYNSIRNGEKKFYKPAKVKSVSAYEDPMRIQGIKASYAYNHLHEYGTEALDLNTRNSISIAKVEITNRNIDIIKDSHPEVYRKAVHLLGTKEYANGIDAIAIPLNEPTPDWIMPFIRYNEIINDNVAKFPLESIGLYRGDPNNNTTNLISF